MTTTIKVSSDLRHRVARHAHRQHTSQAAVLEQALDLLDRETFFSQLSADVTARPENLEEQREREAWLAGPVVEHGASA